MNNELNPQQKVDLEKASALIAGVLAQFKLKIVVNNQLLLQPMDELQTPIEPTAEAPQTPETAPVSEEVPKTDDNSTPSPTEGLEPNQATDISLPQSPAPDNVAISQ